MVVYYKVCKWPQYRVVPLCVNSNMVSSDPACSTVMKHSRQPVPQDDHTRSTVDTSQHETLATSENSAYSTTFQSHS